MFAFCFVVQIYFWASSAFNWLASWCDDRKLERELGSDMQERIKVGVKPMAAAEDYMGQMQSPLTFYEIFFYSIWQNAVFTALS